MLKRPGQQAKEDEVMRPVMTDILGNTVSKMAFFRVESCRQVQARRTIN
jgi:hypothetical protein